CLPPLSGGAREDLQPERFEQGHAHNVLALVTHFDVLEEDSLQLETKPGVEIEVVDIDVARVDVNLVQVQDQERVVKKAERGTFADAFALQPGFTHQLFHLQFARHRIDVLTADDSDRLLVVIDAKIVARGVSEVFLQIDFLLWKNRHEALSDRRVLEPLDDFGDDGRLQRPERHMLNGESLALLPLVLHGIEREDVVVVLNAFAGLLLLRHEVVKQMRRDSQDFVLPDTIVDEFVVKALGDQSEHLVALLFEDRLFIILFAHTSTWLEVYGSSVRHLQF